MKTKKLFSARERGAICNCMKRLERGWNEDRLNVGTSERRNVGEKRQANGDAGRGSGEDGIRYTQGRIAEKCTACQLLSWYRSNGIVSRWKERSFDSSAASDSLRMTMLVARKWMVGNFGKLE
jgi:hypothetical protein